MPIRLLLLAVVVTVLASASFAAEPSLPDRIDFLLEELGAPSRSERTAAEEALSDLGKESAKAAETVLSSLPATDRSMPPQVRDAIERVRLRVQRHVAQRATGASTVTLRVAQATLPEVFEKLEEQTGNKFRDGRGDFGGGDDKRLVTLDLKDEPFWPAIDKLLDEADLSVYSFGEEGQLTLVDREPNAGSRFGSAAYAGPFRFEPISLAATRGLRDDSTSRLDLRVEVAWEPRLRPIAISQPMTGLTVSGSGGAVLGPRTPEQSIDLEATPGEQALEMNLSLVLPERGVERIDSIAGRMTAMIPATTREFRVEQVGAAELPVVQEFGDAVVSLERFRKQNAIWELHMRLTLKNAGDSLASHRGWVFQNSSYLIDADGKRYEHAGFETTMQTSDEIGVAYLYDLSGGDIYGFGFDDAAVDPGDEDAEPSEIDPKELTWVYETPTGVYTVPVDWKLGPIDLP
ncbi:MAG: hypothetical protein AAF266_05670 [Planctomycetota bacterium]